MGELGWRILPAYRVNPKTGEWKHHTRVSKFPGRQWLGHMRWPAVAAAAPAAEAAMPEVSLERAWAAQLAEGRQILIKGSVGGANPSQPSGGGSALGAFALEDGDRSADLQSRDWS